MRNPFDPAVIVVASCVFAIILTAGWSLHERAVLDDIAVERDARIQSFERLSSLKSRWGNSPEIQRKTAFLLAHPALIRQEKRQKTLFLEYANLSKNNFDQIVSTLMNAPFVITKLTLARTVNTGTISVEIEQ